MTRLPVIFRTDRTGEVTAVFPTLPADRQGNMTCYAHVGQHGGCCLDWYRTTRRATEAEAAPLLRELRSIYEADGDCRLIVRQRLSPAMALELWRATA